MVGLKQWLLIWSLNRHKQNAAISHDDSYVFQEQSSSSFLGSMMQLLSSGWKSLLWWHSFALISCCYLQYLFLPYGMQFISTSKKNCLLWMQASIVFSRKAVKKLLHSRICYCNSSNSVGNILKMFFSPSWNQDSCVLVLFLWCYHLWFSDRKKKSHLMRDVIK